MCFKRKDKSLLQLYMLRYTHNPLFCARFPDLICLIAAVFSCNHFFSLIFCMPFVLLASLLSSYSPFYLLNCHRIHCSAQIALDSLNKEGNRDVQGNGISRSDLPCSFKMASRLSLKAMSDSYNIVL